MWMWELRAMPGEVSHTILGVAGYSYVSFYILNICISQKQQTSRQP